MARLTLVGGFQRGTFPPNPISTRSGSLGRSSVAQGADQVGEPAVPFEVTTAVSAASSVTGRVVGFVEITASTIL
jgi:hypothetical protein